MGFRINTNVASLTAQTSAAVNNRNLDSSLAKLSSGLRINKAADDASGLAIANSLRAQASSLGQAVSNGNDAIGLIQTADGALSEYSNVLDTIKTKSVQAASDGQNSTSRLAIQKDISRLLENLNTIAKTTSFNGQKLLSGTFTNKEFQVGANANETIKASISSAETSQIGQTSRATLTVAAGENQLTLKSAISGKSITLESVNVLSNNDPENGLGNLAGIINKHSAETGITAKAVVSTTTDTAVAAGTTGNDFSINGINIGAINVSANDSDGALLTAINSKTTQTGVSATTSAGKLTLTASDGRAISVTGDASAVLGTTSDKMSTIGHLEVVQAGSATFQITGSDLGKAAGADITTTGSTNMVQDSQLAIGSTLGIGSTLAAGTKTGVIITATAGMSLVTDSSTADMTLAVGSTLASGSVVNKDTVLASKIGVSADTVLSSDMFVKAGSTLAANTKLDAGTVLQQDMTVAGVSYKSGMTLTAALTLSSSVILSKDMTINVASTSNVAQIGDGSTLLAGTITGADITLSSTSTLATDMTLKTGSVLSAGSTMAAGSVLGQSIVITSAAHVTTQATDLKVGSILTSASIIKEGSSLGGEVTMVSATSLNSDMLVKAGSLLISGTVLKAGTVITQDLTAAQAGNAGVGIKAGTVLGTDLTTTADIYTQNDMTLLKGTGTAGSIQAGSKLAANGGNQNSASLQIQRLATFQKLMLQHLKVR
ncbi:flagellin N-terminal helical domain-containing protein [Sulfurospirillum diekertiae]|uniref:flagellin N-terminal helical domain-containing protein n=1 Tax=Sulfurospirillum diekertiae TaxID=1854492 RepID=UPI000B4C819C|nr:Flagellin A [Sulfurospirillum diekertiae]